MNKEAEVYVRLPCETCDGSGLKPRRKPHCPLRLCKSVNATCGNCDLYIPRDLCPDCETRRTLNITQMVGELKLLHQIRHKAYEACCTGNQEAKLACIDLCEKFDPQ